MHRAVPSKQFHITALDGIRGLAVRLPAHFWSLAVEEHFYLVWPTVVLLCSRRWLYRASLICIGISVVTRLLLLHLNLSVFFFTFTRLDGLAVGALLALFVRGPKGPARLTETKPLWLLIGAFVLLVPMWIFAGGKAGEIAETLKYLLLALLYGALTAAALDPARPSIGHFFSNRALTILGKSVMAFMSGIPFCRNCWRPGFPVLH